MEFLSVIILCMVNRKNRQDDIETSFLRKQLAFQFVYSFLCVSQEHFKIFFFIISFNFSFFLNFLLLFTYSYPHFPLVTLPCPTHTPPATVHSPSPCCLCLWALYMCSLTCPFPFFPPLYPSCLPSGHCQFILYFRVSHSIFLFYSLKQKTYGICLSPPGLLQLA